LLTPRTRLESTDIPDIEREIQVHVDAALKSKPIYLQKLTQIKQETATNEQLQIAMRYFKHGWPEHARNVPVQIHGICRARLQLSVFDDTLTWQ